MGDFYLAVGDTVSFSKTVSESDVYLFAGITGDFHPNHINEAFMRTTPYGARIVHGALLVGFMSTVSSRIVDGVRLEDAPETPVSLGYDRVRFLKAVRIGDTITLRYTIREVDEARRRTTAQIEVTNEEGELVAVAEHILKFVQR